MNGLRLWWRDNPFYVKLPFIMLVLMSIQHTPIEGYTVSFVKVGMMSVAICYYLFNATVNKAVITGGFYWLVCFTASLFQEQVRWSTVLYLGLYIGAYFAFYQCVHFGAFTLRTFERFLRGFIYVFLIALLVQQMATLVGFNYVRLLNLNQETVMTGTAYYKWNHLPTLTCEPSHTAVVLTGLVLGWLRCLEIEYGVRNVSLGTLFSPENRGVTLAYLYLICFMGSGTGWIGFGILLLYFVRHKTLYYIVPAIGIVIAIGFYSDNEQFRRAFDSASATLTMNQKVIRNTDGSAAYRIVPLVNTVKSDLNAKDTWVGKGTIMEGQTEKNWFKIYDRKISTMEQYGLIAFLFSLILLYSCMIRRVLSLETVCFIVLLTCNVGNVYIVWSMLYVFTVVRYLQENPDRDDDECIDTDRELQHA